MSTDFTESQLAALEEIQKNRFTVVRAGPGSGKTRVFVEALRRELSTWSSMRGGIAALSFTNVAHEVITERLGRAPSAPHFIGTLDGFFWRYVVRPFGHLVGLTKDGPTLIPSPLDELLSGPTKKFGPENRHNGSIFKIALTGGTEDKPDLSHRDEGIKLVAPFREWNFAAKKKEWATRGRVTHSDSQYLASCVLKGGHGPKVIELVARRFPVVLVDEFQDTGWFPSRALLALLSSEMVRGAVVGDPDQAIYQFGGAHRGLFDEAEMVAGGKRSALDESHRCRPKVAAVATALSRSGKKVVPKESDPGRTIILVHTQNVPALDPIFAALTAHVESKDIAVLARKGRTVKQLTGTTSEHSCPWQSGVGRRMTRAVEHLLRHEPTLAARLVRRELGELLFEDEMVTNDDIRAAGIALTNWRTSCHAVLMEAASAPEGETWNAWQARMKKRVAEEATRLGKPLEAKTLGARFKKASKGGDASRGALASTLGTTRAVITVHQAKGDEFDAVLLYVPKPHAGHAPCPSVEWWSEDPDSEEQEVAFVACSRARHTLVLAVHAKTRDALKTSRRDFYDRFEVYELGDDSAAQPRTQPTEPSNGSMT